MKRNQGRQTGELGQRVREHGGEKRKERSSDDV